MKKIHFIQFDPNGFCNGKCWYCPVRYEPLPKYQNMKISDIDKIFKKIYESDYTADDILVYTAHYNEFLLYPYIQEFFDILRKYKMKTMVLTNGTNLTPNKLETINKNKDVIVGINLNTPTIDKNEWIKQVGLDEYQYNKLISNLNYISDNNLGDNITIGVNGITSDRWLNNNGNLSKLKKFPKYIKDNTLDIEFDKFKNKYPNLEIFKNPDMVDRNSILEKNNIYSTTIGNLLNNKKDLNTIIGCGNGDRFNKWLHINSSGNVFLCCNDYNYEYVFGNILEQSLEEIWESKKRKDIIKKAKTKMCLECTSAIWK